MSVSSHLINVNHIPARNALTRFRLGISPLRPHRLRHAQNVSVNNLKCPFYSVEESEVHFVFICPKYTDLREKYIPAKFYRHPSSFRLALLLANENHVTVNNVATYVYKALRNKRLCRNSHLEHLYFTKIFF